jgi:glycosyltransferase involved in cell wall biosynthesis
MDQIAASCSEHERPREKMRILSVSAFFPPNVIGGAERSAFNFATWLGSRGHDVAVLTAAASPDQICDGKPEGDLLIWRVRVPRLYHPMKQENVSSWKKPIWHLQDHFDPRNRYPFRKIIKLFQPTHAVVHIIQGLGYNGLDELGRAKIPVTFFLHDLGLACIKLSMFVNGMNCSKQCTLCRLSSAWKFRYLRRIDELAFVSPSRSNLDTLANFTPLKNFIHTAILNPNKYPIATETRSKADYLRFLYVGRLQANKGVSVLLEALEPLAKRYKLSLTVIGAGPDEVRFRTRYASSSWVKFTGFVPQEVISNYMIQSDLLMIPSIWAENSPGVVVHALSLGLPVVGSNYGGIPELIDSGVNGLLVEPGNVEAWREEIDRLLSDPAIIERWRLNALANKDRFDQDMIGLALEKIVLRSK